MPRFDACFFLGSISVRPTYHISKSVCSKVIFYNFFTHPNSSKSCLLDIIALLFEIWLWDKLRLTRGKHPSRTLSFICLHWFAYCWTIWEPRIITLVADKPSFGRCQFLYCPSNKAICLVEKSYILSKIMYWYGASTPLTVKFELCRFI